MFFSHGSSHSNLVLIKDNLDFKIHSRSLHFSGGLYSGFALLFLNIYAPNKCSEQFLFFKDVSDILKGARVEQDHPSIAGGDFNIILDHVLDGQGGESKRKDSGKIVEDMSAELDLVDIWLIRNPTVTRFTWRQKKPILQIGA